MSDPAIAHYLVHDVAGRSSERLQVAVDQHTVPHSEPTLASRYVIVQIERISRRR